MNKSFLLPILVLLCMAVCFPIHTVRAQGTVATDPDFTVAFIGDSEAGTGFQSVLDLIKREGAQMVLHQGDFDYDDGPTVWMGMIDATLGTNFPYFGSDGNHDNWAGDGYGAFFTDRLAKTGIGGSAANENYSIVYKGLKVVFSQEGGNASFIQQQLAADTHIWKICSWHKNQQAMQVGGKGDEQGWGDYEACRTAGAIIATGHEHNYSRTKTLTSMQNQTIDASCSDGKNLCVAPGKTFAFVSGIGGKSIREQQLCLPATAPYGCPYWAKMFTDSSPTSEGGPAEDGALFITFNYQGNPNRAHGVLKTVSNRIIDEFDITAGGAAAPTVTPSVNKPTATPSVKQPTATPSVNKPTSTPGGPTHTPPPSSCTKTNPIQFSCFGDWYLAYSAGGDPSIGDFNNDGIASLTDFETWRRAFVEANVPTPTPSGPTVTPGGATPTISDGTGCAYPAQKLNLAHWKVTLPTGSSSSPTEVTQPELATFTVDPWFKVNTDCTGVQFRAHTSGVTTSGSGYPRSELREMTNNGNTRAAWSNDSGTHTMIIDQAITKLPTTKNHVVAGQIHDANDDVTVIRLEGNTLYSTLGNTTHAQVIDTNYVLGTRFQIKFEATGGKILVYYKANGAPNFVLKHTINQTISGAYFKAGAYTQSNCSTESSCGTNNYGEVHIYGLTVSHQ